MFKKIGRDRTAGIVGGELAQFHFQRGNFNQAEDLLLELGHVYRHDGWSCLVDQVNNRLVELYSKSEKLDKLAKVYYGMVKSDREAFSKFFDTIQSSVENSSANQIMRFPLEQIAAPSSAQCFPSSRVDVDQELSVTISVELNIPLEGVQAEVWLDEICGIETEPTHNFSCVSQSIASNSMVDVFSLGRDTVHTQGGQSVLSMGTSVPLTGFHTSKASSDSGDGILVHNNQIRFSKSFKTRSPELRYALQLRV